MKIKLNNVRLAFPSLFEKAVFEGKPTKYEGTFLISKADQADLVKEIRKAIADMITSDLKGAKIPDHKLCLRDGDETEYDGFQGCFSLKAGNNKRPTAIDRDRSPLSESDERIYSGCRVNAIISLWAQDNQFGKRVNATLMGVQFFADDEPFEGGRSASADDFDAFDADEDFNEF
jgi:hypothetical protein